MAEYVVSASIIPNEMGMSAMDDSIGKDANGNPILDTFFEESGTGEGQFTEAASTTSSTVEIDDVTNTIIYTPAVSKGIEAN